MPTLSVVVVMRTVEKFKAFDIFYLMTRRGPSNRTKVLVYEAYLIAIIVLVFMILYIRSMKRREVGDQ